MSLLEDAAALMDRLVYWIYRLFGLAVRPFSIAATFRLAKALGAIGYYLVPPYRRLALRNLQIAFGSEKSPAELRKIARQHFATLVANLFAGLKISLLPREKILDLVTIEGMEHGNRLVAEKRPIVCTICHIGNWELMAQLTPILYPIPIGTIYQRLGNRFIDAEMRANRGRLGLKLFERKEGFRGALQTLREPGGVGVLVDQHAGDGGLWLPLFGRLASTSPLAATLALRTDAVLLPTAVYTDVPGRWRMVIDPPIDSAGHDVASLTAALNRNIEIQIRRQPSDWLWGHNRWKTPRPRFLLAKYKRGVPEDGADASPECDTAQPIISDARALQPFPILIRSSNWLGDAIMSIPAVRAIKRGRPDARVTILTPAKLADVWKLVPEVDEIVPISPRQSVFSVARSIRGRFEVAVVFPNSLRTALEVWLAKIPRRVGYRGHRRSWLLNQIFKEKKTKTPSAPEHQSRDYLRLAEFIGADVSPAAIAPAPSTDAKARALPPEVFRIAICPGAEYGPAKRWLPERFAEAMAEITQGRTCEWIIVGVEKDAPIAEEIIGHFKNPVRNLVGKTTLAELIAELRNCHLVVSNDSGTMHLAALLEIPTVAIFGSTEPALTGPLGGKHRVLRHHVSCSPCFLRECPIDFRCMRRVTAAEVTAAAKALLGVMGETPPA